MLGQKTKQKKKKVEKGGDSPQTCPKFQVNDSKRSNSWDNRGAPPSARPSKAHVDLTFKFKIS